MAVLEFLKMHAQSIAYWSCILCMLLSGYMAEKSTHLRRIFMVGVLLAVNWAVLSIYYLPLPKELTPPIDSGFESFIVAIQSMMTVFSAYLFILVGMMLSGEAELERSTGSERSAYIRARLNRRAVRALGLMIAPYTIVEVLKAASRKDLVDISFITPINYDGSVWVALVAGLSIYGYWWIWSGIHAMNISDRRGAEGMKITLSIVLALYALLEIGFVVKQWMQFTLKMDTEFLILFAAMKLALTLLLMGLLLPRHNLVRPSHYLPAFPVRDFTQRVKKAKQGKGSIITSVP